MKPSLVLHFVRHGQSEWNAEGRVQGQTSHVPLTELGHHQARTASRTLAHSGALAVISSDLARAVQTAVPIATRLGAPLQTTAALRERGLGTFEGRRSAEVWTSPAQPQWSDPDWRPPGGESTRDVYRRVACFLTALAARPPGPVVVIVTHGDTLRIALGHLQGAGPDAIPWSQTPNGAIVTVRAGTAGDRGRRMRNTSGVTGSA
ncbi:MAG TPA: histidine phosphatase family protein [Mycobacteriales bacterium]|nr:histidine phosphatase family protein [Mycobacteriales bacterium]